MSMQIIMNAAGNLLTNVVLAILGLVGAYVLYYINMASSKVKEQTGQIKDARARKVLENAMDDVVHLATVSVNAMEQTTARALREAVKNGVADREELLALGRLVFDEVKRAIAPAAQEVITKNLGNFDDYLSAVIEDAVLKVKISDADFILGGSVLTPAGADEDAPTHTLTESVTTAEGATSTDQAE